MDAVSRLKDPVIKRIADATLAIREEADLWQMIATNLIQNHRAFRDGQCANNCPRCAGEKDYAEHQRRLVEAGKKESRNG